MLSTPPAFILSQDQTLRSNSARRRRQIDVSLDSVLKLSVGALGPLTGKKLKLALSNVRLTSEKTYCPSLEFHPQYPVVKVPREASRPAALASGARKYFALFRSPCQPLHKTSTILFQRLTTSKVRQNHCLSYFRKRQLAYNTAPRVSRKGFFEIY